MQKAFKVLLTFCVLQILICYEARAQQYFTNVFDFQKINTKSFTVNIGTNNELKHLNSSLHTCLALADLAQNGDWNETRKIGQVSNNIKLRAQKLSYTPFQVEWGNQSFQLRLIFVRPDDQIERPCIILSPGTGGDMDNWYHYLGNGVADYVSKGYAVAYFENWNTKKFLAAVKANPTAASNLPLTTDPEAVELPFYALYQFANAAAKYVVGNSNTLKIKTNQLFAGGNSGGGFSAYSLALVDEDNFTHMVFEPLGSKSHKVKPEYVNEGYTIKGLGIIGSGLFLPEAKMGDLIDPGDSNLRAVLWHGGDDHQIHLDCCPNTPCDENGLLTICGAVEVGARLCEAGIQASVNVNCPGGHLVVCDEINVQQIPPTNAAFVLGPLRRAVQQQMDIQLNITTVFKKIIDQEPASSCNLQCWKPKDYPIPLGNNWHLINAANCIPGAQNAMVKSIEHAEERHFAASVAPNPSSGIFVLSVEDLEEGEYFFSVWSMLGQEMLKGIAFDYSQKQTIDLGHLPNGIYQMVVQQNNRIIFQEKLMLEK
ncbi:MAG: T9SS type A sorting domain-containing protein [Saprospiraceae bacterium]|jgi:hypothetical protein|nr:T9SS type A sorting domain-containing protein [Saprospiraceae bacterium]